MKTRSYFTSIIVCCAVLFLTACSHNDPNKELDEGQVTGEVYSSQEIGWTMGIPKGWTVMSKDELEEGTERGAEAVKDVAGEFDYSGLKHLISFQKDPYNLFQSTSEPYNQENDGDWKSNNEMLKTLLYDTYTHQGIHIDTSSSKAQIDGLDFEVFHITLYGPDGKIILNQDLYSRLVNGFDFGVNLNYNNEKDKQTMMNVWKNSKFTEAKEH